MKKDVNELKKLVHDIMGGNIPMPTVADDTPYAHPIHPAAVHAMHPTIQDAEDVEEETLSLEEVEKEMIRKALEKHNGRRKNAAAGLEDIGAYVISKIKEIQFGIKIMLKKIVNIRLSAANWLILSFLTVLATACSISYKFNGASIDYTKVKTITIL